MQRLYEYSCSWTVATAASVATTASVDTAVSVATADDEILMPLCSEL